MLNAFVFLSNLSDVLAINMNAFILKRSDDDDEDNDDDSPTSDSTSTSDSSDELGRWVQTLEFDTNLQAQIIPLFLFSTITDSGIYNSGSGWVRVSTFRVATQIPTSLTLLPDHTPHSFFFSVSNAYSSAQPKYIEVRVSKRIIGVGWVAFALTTITGFLLLLLPLGTPGHHTTETHELVSWQG